MWKFVTVVLSSVLLGILWIGLFVIDEFDETVFDGKVESIILTIAIITYSVLFVGLVLDFFYKLHQKRTLKKEADELAEGIKAR